MSILDLGSIIKLSYIKVRYRYIDWPKESYSIWLNWDNNTWLKITQDASIEEIQISIKPK